MNQPRRKRGGEGGIERIEARVPRPLAQALRREAAERAISMRAVVEQAIAERYDPAKAAEETLTILRELRTLRRDVQRSEFGVRVMLEAFTLSMKNVFSSLPPPTAAGKAAGESFYNALINAVERVIGADQALVDKLAENLLRFDPEDFADGTPEFPSAPPEATA
ncbi:hypothetical protein [Xanthomonas theicola]|uniref:Uncharacterized protein n=1 Tax=Xanthomonas theicola TaxID=56464 RepID=A0A2S6ZGN2_9XANT|nr:hypothetical protein [Xanthomonas theicola]PPT91413.1 hypothetical protein XthCFBP4691_07755 [Xanthomonas theicola]QNH27217.1 hypothetical protein G4Q83_22385 [Xanthomonas theicola]